MSEEVERLVRTLALEMAQDLGGYDSAPAAGGGAVGE